jgi:5-(carboxyamino)imidazole ribonucleotide mutase
MILVIFGSKSDSRIYEPLMDSLRHRNIEFEFFIASAHKSPALLNKILQECNEKYRLVIAGAGLAAHLPGVIASKTIRPVIGIPINVNYQGLDSLLSISQMPPNVPVLSTGIDNFKEAANNASLILKGFNKVNILKMNSVPVAQSKLRKVLDMFFVKYVCSEKPDSNCINIRLVPLNADTLSGKGLFINVPVAGESTIDDLKNLAKLASKGIWVGLNRLENAGLATVQILNSDDSYSQKLMDYKTSLEKQFST